MTIKNKLTPNDIEKVIEKEDYYIFPGTTTTVCCLTLHTGFHAIGTSACVDPKEFNEHKGREEARKKAVDQVWMLEGYLLKAKISGKI